MKRTRKGLVRKARKYWRGQIVHSDDYVRVHDLTMDDRFGYEGQPNLVVVLARDCVPHIRLI